MGKKIVLEGELVFHIEPLETDYVTLGDDNLAWFTDELSDFLVKKEDKRFYSRFDYGNVRITIERLDDE